MKRFCVVGFASALLAASCYQEQAVTTPSGETTDLDSDTDSDADSDGDSDSEADQSWNSLVVSDSYGGATRVLTEDLDGDGFADIVSGCADEGRLDVWRNLLGDGQNWSTTLVYDSIPGIADIQAGNIGGGGDLDLVVTSSTQHRVMWFEWNEGLMAWIQELIDTDVDFASDIALPAVVAKPGGAWTSIIVASGGAVDGDTESNQDLVGFHGGLSNWTREEVVSNLDGIVEIEPALGAFSYGNVFLMRTSDGDAIVCSPYMGGPIDIDQSCVNLSFEHGFPPVSSVAAGDMDGDDIDDLVLFTEDEGTIHCLRRAYDGSWEELVEVDAEFEGAVVARVADIDGDGRKDIVALSDVSAELVWWRNPTSTTSQWHRDTIASQLTDPMHFDLGDLDGDGDLDVVVADPEGGELTWFENPL